MRQPSDSRSTSTVMELMPRATRWLMGLVVSSIALVLALPLSGADPASADVRANPGAPAWAVMSGDDAYGHWADLIASGVRQRMRWIAAGSFTMGSQPGDADGEKRETPHHVTLTRGFWLAENECTQELWVAVVGSNPSQFTGDPQRPVERVSIADVQGFLATLNDQLRQHCFVLPTEAQWEYACRAGAQAQSPLAESGWYGGNSGGLSHAVKRKAPNPWGLYDMLGNVSEWCGDWLWEYPTNAVEDPIASSAALVRIIRGGNWDNEAKSCRAGFRTGVAPDCRVGIVGFRLCAAMTGP